MSGKTPCLPKSSTYFLPFEKLIAVKSMLAARALPKFEKVPDQCDNFINITYFRKSNNLVTINTGQKWWISFSNIMARRF